MSEKRGHTSAGMEPDRQSKGVAGQENIADSHKKRLHRRTAPLRLSYPPRYTCYPEILIFKRMREDLDVCDIPITADDMSYLSCMPERDRSGEHPDGLSVNLL